MYRIVKNLINTKGSIPTGMDSSVDDWQPLGAGEGSIPTGMDSSLTIPFLNIPFKFHPYGDG